MFDTFGTFTKDGETRVATSPTHAVLLRFTGWREAAPDDRSVPQPPPKAGKGSARDDWAAYARKHGVEVGDDESREDIMSSLVAADVPVE